jgi:hypothetical protein
MSGSDDLRFQMMGLGGPMAPPAPPPAAPEAKKDGKADAGYPTFEGVVGDKAKYEAFVAVAKKTVARLEELCDRGGSAQVKADARKAVRAYDHALELLKKGVELTQNILKERTAKTKAAGAPAGKKK